MGKSKKRLKDLAEAFMAEMADKFPWVEQRMSFDDVDGYPVAVMVSLPNTHADSYWDVEHAARDLEERLAGDGDIELISSVGVQRPRVAQDAG